jgi:hypothetical protein
MKNVKLLLIGLFIIDTILVQSQNWMPINRNQIYNYGINNNNIVVSIKIDSVEFVNNDTVYYINKLCRRLNIDTLLINQPTFLLSQFTKNDDSIKFHYPKTNNSYKLSLHDTSVFLFDSINNITAQCISRSTTTLFNSITDSILIFRLSNADSVVLSENHGIIKYPNFNNHSYYILAGIENSIGSQTPMFNDFFEFNVGDVFEYLIHEEDRFWWTEKTIIRKIEINQKTSSGDTLKYLCKRMERKIFYNSNSNYIIDTLYTISFQTLYFTNYNNSFINKYPEDLFYISSELVTNVIANYNPSYQCFTKIFTSSYLYNSYLQDTLRYAPVFYGGYPETFQDVDPRSFVSFGPNSLSYIYGVGLGVIVKSYFTSNWGPSFYDYDLSLTAAETSNRVYGTFSDDPFFYTGINKLFKSRILIYPNPASDMIIIEIEGNNENTNFEMLNLTGQLVYKGSMLEKTVINTKDFLPGVYMIKFENGKTVEFKKMVKE